MNWDDMRIFLAVARAGQFLGAARRLGVNHATIARRITTLEKSLSVQLFRRQTSGTELTAAGRRFFEIAERIETEMNGIPAVIGPQKGAITGTVRIGAPDGFGVTFLAPRLGELNRRHPELAVQLVPVPQSFSLSRREADIAITTERPQEGRLIAAKLADYTLQLYASEDYVAKFGLPRKASELAQHRLVGYVADLVINPSLDYAWEFDSEWRANFQISSALGQVEAVRAGSGIGILHSFIGRNHRDLVPITDFAPIRRTYWIVYHESARLLPPVQTATAFISEIVARDRAMFT